MEASKKETAEIQRQYEYVNQALSNKQSALNLERKLKEDALEEIERLHDRINQLFAENNSLKSKHNLLSTFIYELFVTSEIDLDTNDNLKIKCTHAKIALDYLLKINETDTDMFESAMVKRLNELRGELK